MKTIIAVATYHAIVPEDMTVSQVQDQVEKEIRNKLDGFSVYVKDYPNEDDQSPMFDLSDVLLGTRSMISVGGE